MDSLTSAAQALAARIDSLLRSISAVLAALLGLSSSSSSSLNATTADRLDGDQTDDVRCRLIGRCSALNKHIVQNLRPPSDHWIGWWRLLLEVCYRSIRHMAAGDRVREVRLSGGSVLVRQYAGNRCRECRRLTVVGFLADAPKRWIDLGELALLTLCRSMNASFLAVYSADDCASIGQAMSYARRLRPTASLCAFAFRHQADVLLDYLGETGAACKLESAVLISPVCSWRQPTVVLGASSYLPASTSASASASPSMQHQPPPPPPPPHPPERLSLLTPWSTSLVASMTSSTASSNGNVTSGVATASASAAVESRNSSRRSSRNSLASYSLPESVDDVDVPVLWMPACGGGGDDDRDVDVDVDADAVGPDVRRRHPPERFFEESLHFTLLRWPHLRCPFRRATLAVRYVDAVHRFFQNRSSTL